MSVKPNFDLLMQATESGSQKPVYIHIVFDLRGAIVAKKPIHGWKGWTIHLSSQVICLLKLICELAGNATQLTIY